MSCLRDIFKKDYMIKITPGMIQSFHTHVKRYESIPEHAAALGSPLLGINKMYFLPKDKEFLFNLVDVDAKDFRKSALQSREVNPSFNIISDPYNLLTIWLVHLVTINTSLSVRLKNEFAQDLLKMMYYKFFTSIVNYNLPHGAKEGVMQLTIDNLSNKYAIKNYGSWKALIENRVLNMLTRPKTHADTFKSFYPDKKVVYILSDAQTGLRKQLISVIQEYYKTNEKGDAITASDVYDRIGDDKSLKVIESSISVMASNVIAASSNLSEFLDYEYIDMVSKLTNNVSKELLTRLLTKFSGMAEQQDKKHERDKISGSSSAPIYEGYAVLINHIVYKTYRYCLKDPEVNVRSKVAILKKTINLYRSSRIADSDILNIKHSVGILVEKYSDSKRESTNSSLRLAFILYIIMLTFRFGD